MHSYHTIYNELASTNVKLNAQLGKLAEEAIELGCDVYEMKKPFSSICVYMKLRGCLESYLYQMLLMFRRLLIS